MQSLSLEKIPQQTTWKTHLHVQVYMKRKMHHKINCNKRNHSINRKRENLEKKNYPPAPKCLKRSIFGMSNIKRTRFIIQGMLFEVVFVVEDVVILRSITHLQVEVPHWRRGLQQSIGRETTTHHDDDDNNITITVLVLRIKVAREMANCSQQSRRRKREAYSVSRPPNNKHNKEQSNPLPQKNK